MEFLKLEDYTMGRDVEYPEEWDAAKLNAINLIWKVNEFLTAVGWETPVKVSSGFRPTVLNNYVPNAAKASLHKVGKAVDIWDPSGSMKKFLNPLYNERTQQLLRECGLFMEDPDSTATWCHFDSGNRVDRKTRIFKP
jgi:hypothetical protein